MTRLTARDLRPDPLELHDHHALGRITKRAFLGHAAKFAVTSMAATGLLGALSPNDALARQVSDTDPDILANYLTYASPLGHGEVRGYLVLPAKVAGKVPGVVVAHENHGLTPHIEDVARRVAKAGFIALAPDGLTAVGGYPGNDEAGRELQSKVDPEKLMNDFFAAVEFLMADPRTTGMSGSPASATAAGSPTRRRSPFPSSARRFRSTASRRRRPMFRRSRRRSCSTMPVSTRGSTRAGRPTKPRSGSTARPTRPMSTRRRITASTTTPRRVTTRRRPISPGSGRSTGSTGI